MRATAVSFSGVRFCVDVADEFPAESFVEDCASAGDVIGATALVASLQPPSAAPPRYERSGGLGTLRTTLRNPASAAVVFVVPALAVLGAALLLDYPVPRAVLLAYVSYGLPVGLVGVRRARHDDA
jgi:hypothetical protein